MNANAEIFVRTADLSLFKSAIPKGESKTFAQIESYIETMRQQKKDPRAIAVFGSTYNALMKAVNKGREEGHEFAALSYKGIPLEASRRG